MLDMSLFFMFLMLIRTARGTNSQVAVAVEKTYGYFCDIFLFLAFAVNLLGQFNFAYFLQVVPRSASVEEM